MEILKYFLENTILSCAVNVCKLHGDIVAVFNPLFFTKQVIFVSEVNCLWWRINVLTLPLLNVTTVKPVNKGHPRERQTLIFIDKWSLLRGFIVLFIQ